MYTQFDEKGKIFTNVVTKKPIRVIVQTTAQRIHGDLHVRPNVRLLDALKDEALFIAITDAVIYNADNTPVYTTKFLSVNQNQIIWVLPEGEMDEEDGQE